LKSQTKKLKRIDRKGKPIIKGGKKHKLTFRDLELNKELEEVFIVENYKKYNVLEPEDETTNCNCSIL
jgi:hypothetical protein